MNDNAKQTVEDIVEIINHYDDTLAEISGIIECVCINGSTVSADYLSDIAIPILTRERTRSIASRFEDYFCEEASRC